MMNTTTPTSTPEDWAEAVLVGYPHNCAMVKAMIADGIRMKPPYTPTIVCLCGSTRFYDVFQRANFDETMAGKIVLSVGFYPHSEERQRATWHRPNSDLMRHGETVGITPEQKEQLDQLHMRKIDLCDEVLILNVDGYIGESTARELAYARKLGKPVRFLEEHGQ